MQPHSRVAKMPSSNILSPPNRKITARPYPFSPVTLGDYLRKTRIDLGLTQKQVAEDILKTSADNVRNWEVNRYKISLRFRPKVIELIRFCPYDVSLPFGLRLKERRKAEKLAKFLNVDRYTIDWVEQCEHKPSKKTLKIIEGFLKICSV